MAEVDEFTKALWAAYYSAHKSPEHHGPALLAVARVALERAAEVAETRVLVECVQTSTGTGTKTAWMLPNYRVAAAIRALIPAEETATLAKPEPPAL